MKEEKKTFIFLFIVSFICVVTNGDGEMGEDAWERCVWRAFLKDFFGFHRAHTQPDCPRIELNNHLIYKLAQKTTTM